MKIMVLCPTRNRPREAAELLKSFDSTTGPDSRLHFVVDADDPMLQDYEDIGELIVIPRNETGTMVRALNAAAKAVLHDVFFDPTAIGFVGDDHRFRTNDWDDTITAALDSMGGGFAYADDLAQRHNLPTQVFISTEIISALGWMALPTCKHLYVDNAWRELGGRLSRLMYVPQVIIEHLHPAYGKGEWDEGHVRVNSAEMYNHDRVAYETWANGPIEADLAKIRKVLG